METEAAPPAENGNESATEAAKKPEGNLPNDSPKPPHKSRSRKRSRSRSADIDKELHVTLKQCAFEVNGNSGKITEDEKEEEKPEEDDGKPGKKVEKLGKDDGKPGKKEEKLGKDDGKPGKKEEKSGKGEEKSGKGEEKSGKGEEKSGKGEEKSGKGEERSGKGEEKSVKGEEKSVKGEEKSVKGEEKSVKGEEKSVKRITRSQTTTTDEEKKPEESPVETSSESPKKKTKKQSQPESEATDSDVIVITDEPEPELQFDSSDFDSVEGSPLIVRSGTSRSQTFTVKTCLDFDDDKLVLRSNNTTYDSQDLTNLSTRAVVGSDVTCATYEDEILPHDDSYLQQLREKSLSETLRSLSARKPIRSDYRRLATRTALGAGRTESTVGSAALKRKERSATPEGEETKRFKSEGPSLFASLRGRFGRSEAAEGTPRLMGYKDRNNDLHIEEGLENGVADKKNWCNIM